MKDSDVEQDELRERLRERLLKSKLLETGDIVLFSHKVDQRPFRAVGVA